MLRVVALASLHKSRISSRSVLGGHTAGSYRGAHAQVRRSIDENDNLLTICCSSSLQQFTCCSSSLLLLLMLLVLSVAPKPGVLNHERVVCSHFVTGRVEEEEK